MRKKSRSKQARVGGRKDAAPGSKVRAEADAIIERAIERIHACQQKLDRKVLHGPYGKQQMVETIYGAASDLRRHRLANVIKRRLMKRLRRAMGESSSRRVEWRQSPRRMSSNILPRLRIRLRSRRAIHSWFEWMGGKREQTRQRTFTRPGLRAGFAPDRPSGKAWSTNAC